MAASEHRTDCDVSAMPIGALVDHAYMSGVDISSCFTREEVLSALSAAAAMGALEQDPAAAVQHYRGTVKLIFPDKGFGFLECAETNSLYKRDVYAQLKDLIGLQIGDVVDFAVQVTEDGKPQAKNVRRGGEPAALPYQGTVKSFVPRLDSRGFGFIECAETEQKYGRDIFFTQAQGTMFGLTPGCHVRFSVCENSQGQPQVRHIRRVGGAGPPVAYPNKLQQHHHHPPPQQQPGGMKMSPMQSMQSILQNAAGYGPPPGHPGHAGVQQRRRHPMQPNHAAAAAHHAAHHAQHHALVAHAQHAELPGLVGGLAAQLGAPPGHLGALHDRGTGRWRCPRCTFENRPSNTVCGGNGHLGCKTPRHVAFA
eukprot:TRINITY_DN13736_c0_g1_i1.p1 TRINITY_DN13736_c0_g1~~TRINITY_DN13736_c0_g1_i1.p1  ORF type:complete len:416 (+),score=74.79 TRINITY_DN13736_c0_g1_i1:149-1249(+)